MTKAELQALAVKALGEGATVNLRYDGEVGNSPIWAETNRGHRRISATRQGAMRALADALEAMVEGK